MKTTYTLECDGKPVMLFRAEDEAGAKAVATWCAGHGKHLEGNVTFRTRPSPKKGPGVTIASKWVTGVRTMMSYCSTRCRMTTTRSDLLAP